MEERKSLGVYKCVCKKKLDKKKMELREDGLNGAEVFEWEFLVWHGDGFVQRR